MTTDLRSGLDNLSLDGVDSHNGSQHLGQSCYEENEHTSKNNTTNSAYNRHMSDADTSCADDSLATSPDSPPQPAYNPVRGNTPPHTPQTQQISRWDSPSLENGLPSLVESPMSPSSPESPVSPILAYDTNHSVRMALPELASSSASSKVISRQSSSRRAESAARRRAAQSRVGESHIGRQIGQGSFSQIFQAYSSTGMYAVKVRSPSTDPVSFAHERCVLETLERRNQHNCRGSENVVKFYPELSETDHFVFKSYESSSDEVVRSPQFHVDPNSIDYFDFRIMSQPLVGIERWIDWAQQLKDGLDFIHRQDIVHTDIKPDNVLVDSQSHRLVIADFSSAIDINMQPASVLAKDLIEGFAWSPVYTDPQVRKQTSSPSFGSDIYALGLVLAFVATGTEPYSTAKNGTQRSSWMDRIKPLDSFDPDVLPRLSRVRPIIDICLNRSFDGFDAALDKLRQEVHSSNDQ